MASEASAAAMITHNYSDPAAAATVAPIDTTLPTSSKAAEPFTPRVEGLDPLFSTNLISPAVSAALPTGYKIRPLQRTDYHTGFLDVLRVLTSVGDISEAGWNDRYEWMRGRSEYYILVVLDADSKIVGTGALIVERKFIHNLGVVGHIEDIAVASDQQGKKLGLRIIQALDYVAEKVGCYKVRASAARSLAELPGHSTAMANATYLTDNLGLLRSERGVLYQVRVQESGFADGSLLREAEDCVGTERRSQAHRSGRR